LTDREAVPGGRPRGGRAAALHALRALEQGRTERLDDALALDALSPADRDLARELARGVERMRLLLDWVLGGFVQRGLPRNPTTLTALRLGAYQLLWLDRIPARAAVHATVELVRTDRGFVNAVLRRVAEAVVPRAAGPAELALGPARALAPPRPLPHDELERLALEHALPGWLVARWAGAHGRDGARQAARASSSPAALVLRPHRLRATAAALAERLAGEGAHTEPVAGGELLRWRGGVSPFATAAFRDGWFVAQDPTSVAAAAAVAARPGEVVLDLCAAPGTKTAQLAQDVAPTGRVHAFEVDERRRARIAENVARLGLERLVTIAVSLDHVPPADAVLADVPCSNTGVLARRLEVRRRISPAAIAALAATQRSILAQALAHARPGGRVVYATCSIEPEENRAVVDAVLAGRAGVRMVRDQLTLPQADAHDGGYLAVLQVGA
jgi:16S rRNA (cytosine967-C5)-methyltransferase